MLFCGLTQTRVLLLLFVPGIRVIQHSADRENERSIKKLRRAAAETVRALRARLEQVILRIRLRREPGTLLLTLRVPKDGSAYENLVCLKSAF